jgi:arylsulfatase A-like enzyme
MNTHKTISALLALAALLLPLPGQAGAQGKPVKNIIVIGWDGAQRNHTKELLDKGELPTLAALTKEGKLADIDVITGATDTKAGWTQLLTGYNPDKTGVYSNGKYQPIPEGYSVFERLEKHFGPANIDTVAIIGKKGHVDNDPPTRVPYEEWLKQQRKNRKINQQAPGKEVPLVGAKIVEENGRKFVDVPGKPWFLASKNFDLWENGLIENEKVYERAAQELEKRKDHRFFFFVHFAQPDHVGHKFGENSQEYSDGIKDDDAKTGQLIAKLKELGIYGQTLVYVIVDHGFNEGEKGHRYAPYVFVGTNDPLIKRNGTRADIAPTILKRFGLDLSKIEPKLDGIPLDEPAPELKAPAEPPAGWAAQVGKNPGKANAAANNAATPAERKGKGRRARARNAATSSTRAAQ